MDKHTKTLIFILCIGIITYMLIKRDLSGYYFDVNKILGARYANQRSDRIQDRQDGNNFRNLPNLINCIDNNSGQKCQENNKRIAHLQSSCQLFKTSAPITTLNSYKKYLYTSLNVLNDDIITEQTQNINYNPLYILCLPPKTGSSNLDRLFYSIYRNISQGETRKRIDGGVSTYKLLPHIYNEVLYTSENFVTYKIKREKRGLVRLDPEMKELKTINHNLVNELFEKLLEKHKNRLLFDLNGQEEEPQSSFAILNVRHPFARLISAYFAKWKIRPGGFEHEITKWFKNHIIESKKYETGSEFSTNSSEPKFDHSQYYTSFSAFCTWLSEQELTKSRILNGLVNAHWLPIYHYSAACEIPWSIITKTENLNNDADFIIKNVVPVGSREDLVIENKHKGSVTVSGGNGTDEDALKASVLKMMNLVDRRVVLKLYEIYYWDFVLFDYDPYL